MQTMMISLGLAVLSIQARTQTPSMNTAPFVIPELKQWQGSEGQFSLLAHASIVYAAAQADSLAPIAQVLQKDLQAWMNVSVRAGQAQPGDIVLGLDTDAATLGPEGYKLIVKPHQLLIIAPRAKGIFWGTRTLLQVLQQDSLHKHFPCGVAIDAPEYAIRGFVLDDGRKFFSLDFLQQYVKLLSYYKFNDFHIHLNDNGFKKYFHNNWDSTYAAFRLQSDRYPALTAKDGFYTKQEFRDLQALARSYGVNIVPEIDVPAHALAFTHMRPEIGSKKYGMDHLDLDNPVTYQVIDSVFGEYLTGPDPVFSGPEVHIGTDEYAKEAAESFRAFTDHYIRLVEGYGKSARVWGALTHAQGSTPVKVEGVTMNVWYNGYADPVVMKKLGYKIISTPDEWLYIVPAAGYYYDYLDLPGLFYKWEPIQVGDVRFAQGDPQILGGSFAVWNDIVGNGITEKDVHDRVFPALQVLSQKMWRGTDSALAYPLFATRAKHLTESPGYNMRAKLPSKNGVVYQHNFVSARTPKGLHIMPGKTYAPIPFTEIGYDYKVTFTIWPETNNPPDAVLFASPHAIVKLRQGKSNLLGFSREGYDYQFDYRVPVGQWTTLTIAGDHTGTSLYAGDSLIQRLGGMRLGFPGVKDSITKVQTLVFPLKRMSDSLHSFHGYIRDVKVEDVSKE
jgi:hexosaminidase